MPLSRYQIRNEYSLADLELYRAADKDDPEALLEGVAMAGLVGVLRQLGDLAEFAAEIFHDLHEEAMATAARGHGLTVRVQQLEAEFPSIEKAFLSQTNHSVFFCNAGIDWHPNLHTDQNLITQGDLPRFVMDSYEECRGPPRLFLLDKFDVAGAGACLKRYTDPSFFKVEASSNGMTSAEVQRERKARKTKKKGSCWRNGETPEVLPKSHAKLHQLFLEERVENGVSDPARLVKLKRRLNGFPFDSKTGESYMEKFLKTLSLEDKVVHEISVGSPPSKFPYNITSESGLEIVGISTVSSGKESVQGKRSPCSSPDMDKTVLKPSMDELHEDLINGGILEVPKPDISFTLHNMVEEKEMSVNGESRTDGSGDGYQSDGIPSEIDSYMDAPTTMESEIETATEFRAKNGLGVLDIEYQGTDFDTNEEQLQAQSLDSQPLGNSTASDDGNNSSKKGKSNFSHSDSASISPKNTPLDGDVSAEVFPSNENFEAEITGMSSDQVSLSEEGLVSQPPEHAVSNGAFIEVPKIPRHYSEFGEPSSNSRHTDSAPMHLPVEQGAISNGSTLEGPELDGLSSNHNEYDSGFVDTEENAANLDGKFPCTAKLSDVPSQTKIDSPPTVSAENQSVDKLGDGDSKVFSYALTHLENNLGAVSPEKKSRECLFDDVLQTENAEDSGTEDFVNSQFNSPHSVEEPPFALDLSKFGTCNPDVKPDSIVSVDDTIPSAEKMENNVGVVSPEKKCRECLFDDVLRTENAEDSGTEDIVNSQFNSPHSVISRAEETPFALDLSNFGTCNPEEKPDSVVSVDDAIPSAEEMEVNSTPAVDSLDIPEQWVSEITDDVQPLELNSAEVGLPYSGGKNLDGGVGTKAGEGMDFTPDMNLVRSDAATLGFSSDSDNCQGPALLTEVRVHSDEKETEVVQSETVVEVTAVSAPDTDTDANEDDVNSVTANVRKLQEECLSETRLQQNHKESGTQKEVNQHTVASPDLDSLVCNTVSYGHSEPESVNNVSDSSPTAENIFHFDDATAVSSSSKRTAQDSESKSPQQSNLIENTEDALSSPTHCFAELEVPLEQKVDVHTDHHDTKLLHVGEESPESFTQLEKIPLNHMHQEGRDNAYSDSCPEHLPSQLTGQKIELQADQLDVESLQAGEASSEFAQFDQMQSLNHIDHERCFHSSFESCAANLPNEASVLDLIPHSGSHKLDIFEQAMDPLSSVFPFLGLLPEVTQINLEEMPPLPPLPPVQWRIGKLQNASLASYREVVHHNVDHFPPKADEKTQMGPFLPLSAVKDENSQVCDMVQSNPMPTMSNHINSQDDFITLGRTESMNPFLKLPTTYDERPQHGFQDGVGRTVHPSFDECLPEATIEETASSYASGSLHELVQPQHQLRPEATLENKQLEHTLISDVKVMNTPDTIVPPPTIEDEEPQSVPPAAEGETVWSSGTYYLPAIEGEKPSENHPMKLPQPRSPLIEAVAAHDKSRLRKVTKRVQPQKQKVEERDSLLEQIRTKSFNLKPAVATRPSIQGPKTNLKVAAILEKANAIRQALAGSDEDDDTDSWSDS